MRYLYQVVTSPSVRLSILLAASSVFLGKLVISCVESIACKTPIMPVFLKQTPFFCILGAATLAYIALNKKQIQNEWGSIKNIVKHYRDPKNSAWWTEIILQKLWVGALPMENLGHREKLQELGITDFLSLVEDHEFEPRVFYTPLRHKEGIDNWLQIKTPDYEPPTIEVLEQAANWIHTKIENGGKVYVHCKSGKGRSVAACLAYILQHGIDKASEFQDILAQLKNGSSFEKVRAIHSHLKTVRPQISGSPRNLEAVATFLENTKEKKCSIS